MAKLVKLTISERKENPLTEEQKKQCSEETIDKIKKYFEGGKTLKTNGYYNSHVGGKLVRVEWELEDVSKGLTPDMVDKADFFVREGEMIEEKNWKEKDKYMSHAKALEYAKSMCHARSVGFFMLAAYIEGYDVKHTEEIKKLQKGEHVDPDIFEEICADFVALTKIVQRDKKEDAIDLLLSEMYAKDFKKTKGVHLENKNIIRRNSFTDGEQEWCVEDYSTDGKQVSKMVEVECTPEAGSMSSEERYKLAKIIQKDCDKEMTKGIKEGSISYTSDSGTEIKAKWVINDDEETKATIEQLKKNLDKDTKRNRHFDDAFTKLSPQAKMGVLLKTGAKMGYLMPYFKEANALTFGVEPSNYDKKRLSIFAINMLAKIQGDDRIDEAVRIMGEISLSLKN